MPPRPPRAASGPASANCGCWRHRAARVWASSPPAWAALAPGLPLVLRVARPSPSPLSRVRSGVCPVSFGAGAAAAPAFLSRVGQRKVRACRLSAPGRAPARPPAAQAAKGSGHAAVTPGTRVRPKQVRRGSARAAAGSAQRPVALRLPCPRAQPVAMGTSRAGQSCQSSTGAALERAEFRWAAVSGPGPAPPPQGWSGSSPWRPRPRGRSLRRGPGRRRSREAACAQPRPGLGAGGGRGGGLGVCSVSSVSLRRAGGLGARVS